MPTLPDSAGEEDGAAPAQPRVPLGGDQVGKLCAALEDAFTLDQLRQLMVMGLDGNLRLNLDAVVPVAGRNLHDICNDLVLWALRDERVGLHGLLDAALRTNPANPLLLALQSEWAGVTFTAPACPYPGMKPFTASERGRFYGRDAEIQAAVDWLRRRRFLAVIGSSGSGKSSLLAAGILPALETSHYFAGMPWDVHTMRPGATPFTTLAALLDLRAADGGQDGAPPAVAQALPNRAAGTRLLLVVDQYEELFTTAAAPERDRFERTLLQLLAVPDFYLVLAARADFYANLMASPLWPQIREHRLEITPPRGDALREAIALPARDVGVQLQPELVERLLADAGEEPGVLPFVQETLVMLWAHAGRGRIGLDAYTDLVGDKSGRSGLQVALADHADYVYLDVLADDSARAAARRILLRLVQFGEGRADTRRQQTVDELRKGTSQAQEFDGVLATLTANRLLTLSDEARRVDLSHEALIGGWPRLREWIGQRRVAELTRRRLEEKAGERQRLRQGDGDGGLLDAVELAEAEAWVKGPDAADLGVSDDLAALVADSRRALEHAARRLRRRSQALAVALAAALLAMAVAVLLFFNAQNEAYNASQANAAAQVSAAEAVKQQEAAVASAGEADKQRATAEANAAAAQRAAHRAQANELAVYAQNGLALQPDDPSVPLLLAVDAVETTWRADNYVTANADRALQDAVAFAAPYRMALPRDPDGGVVSAAAYSPDGRAIVTAGTGGAAGIWDAATGEELRQLVGQTGTITSAVYSADGKTIVTTGGDNHAHIWDAATGRELYRLKGSGCDDSANCAPTYAAFSPDGSSIVTTSTDGIARIWDTATGEELRGLALQGDAVHSAAFSPDGKSIVTTGTDGIARIWETATGKELRKFESTGPLDSAGYSPDSKTIVTTGDSQRQPTRAIIYRTVGIWDAAGGKELLQLAGDSGEVTSAAFSPDSASIVTAGSDGRARVWDAATGEEQRALNGHGGAVLSAAYSPDGKTIVTANADGVARIWGAATSAELREITGNYGVAWAAYSPDGKTIAGTSGDELMIWDAATNEELYRHSYTVGGDTTRVLAAGARWDGKSFFTKDDSGAVHIRDAATGEKLFQLTGHSYQVYSAAYSPDRMYIVTAGCETVDEHISCQDSTVRIWAAATGQEVRQLAGHSDSLRSAAYSPDGKTIVAGGCDTRGEDGSCQSSTAHIWDAATGQEVRRLKGHTDDVLSAAYSPDGKTIVTTSYDRTARVWEAATGKELFPLGGDSDGGVFSAAYSPDGKSIVTAHGDATVRIWAAATGSELRRLTGHGCNGNDTCVVFSAAYSPDGKHIVSTGIDQTVRIWDADIDQLLAKAKSLVPRDPPLLTPEEQQRYGMN